MARYQKEMEAAIRAVRDAALLTRSIADGITTEVLEKRDRSPVTLADFGSQAIVCRALGEAFPADSIIGEEDAGELSRPEQAGMLARLVAAVGRVEAGAAERDVLAWLDRGGASAASDRFWTLDPIDGTKGFLRKEQYAISLALVVGGETVLGALGCPNLALEPERPETRGVLFTAVRGEGATRRPLYGEGPAARIRVSPEGDPRRLRFCESVEKEHSSHGDAARIAELLEIDAEPVRLDSQAKYAVVARGEAEAYLRLPKSADYVEKIWDHAGGAIVVEEAGGKVTDVMGHPIDLTCGRALEKNRGIVASNGALHEALLGAIRDLGIA
ncbi:MAG: 3'(2'),5'-bisphosphate nucleotidase [Proteobacteria bacterium]|jgi:3'(2'), 5'-bisphosphate nucleotidase|nr:3'(2'),5'-bisphosphate nucleotidase [Pseudomonadota bacterium]